MRIRLAIVALFAFVTAVSADAPFEKLSYEKALKKAEGEKKVVMIDFYTTWCGPCKMLDAKTWPDKKVRGWLGKHAVSLKVDAEADRKLAAKFRVRAYPTIVFVRSDGEVLDRIMGFVTPDAFIKAADAAISGKPAAEKAKEDFKASDENDPMARMQYGQELAEAGQNDEALKQFLWCFDEGDLHDPSFAEVRLTQLMGAIVQLCQVHPPAVEALKQRRSDAEQAVKDFIAGKEIKEPKKPKASTGLGGLINRVANGPAAPAIVRTTLTLATLNEVFRARDRTIELYDAMKGCDRENADAARMVLFHQVARKLLDDRRYDDIMRDGAPLVTTKERIRQATQMKSQMANQPGAGASMNRLRIDTINTACRYFEACLGAKRPEMAEEVKKELLDYESSLLVYETLLIHAARARQRDVVKALGDEAKVKLTGKDAETIGHRVRANLKSIDAQLAKEAEKKDTSGA